MGKVVPSHAWRGAGAVLVLLALAMLGFASAAIAATAFPSVFVVSDIPVSADGKGGAAAREAARIGGQRQALQVMLQRLTTQSDWPHLPSPDDKEITSLVLDFQVQKEHMSPSHYVGTYTFRFNPARIRALLQKSGLNSSELVSKPVVIVPLISIGGGYHLWDEPNPWRDAWNASNGRTGLVPWIVPLGDLGDVQVFDVPQALNPTPDVLTKLSQRYDGGDPVIVTAKVGDGGDGATLAITVLRFTQGGKEQASTSVTAEKADAGLYNAGVVAVRTILENLWKQGPTIPVFAAGKAQSYQVTVPVTDIQQWATIRDHLDHVDGIRDPQIIMMSRDQIVLNVQMAADPQTMRVAFSQQDLVLTPGADGGTVQLAGAGTRALDTVPPAPLATSAPPLAGIAPTSAGVIPPSAVMPSTLSPSSPAPIQSGQTPPIPSASPAPAAPLPQTGGFLTPPPGVAMAPGAGPLP